jgi:two-component system response regulator
MNPQPLILLVEDNDDDAELTERAFQEARIANPLVRVRDGVEALDFLFRRGQHAGRAAWEQPAVVLLDLKLPRLNGLDVLKAVRADPRTAHLPVVILTSSAEETDRLTAYEHHANSYVQKPVDAEQGIEAARQLGLYWVVLNQPAPLSSPQGSGGA